MAVCWVVGEQNGGELNVDLGKLAVWKLGARDVLIVTLVRTHKHEMAVVEVAVEVAEKSVMRCVFHPRNTGMGYQGGHHLGRVVRELGSADEGGHDHGREDGYQR